MQKLRQKREKLDIHNSEIDLKNTIKRVRNNSKIGRTNSSTLMEFKNYLIANSYSNGRIIRYLIVISRLGERLNKSFKKATKSDMLEIFGEMETKGYTGQTKMTYKSLIKRFYKWLTGENEYYPDCVSWVKVHSKNVERHPSELLTLEEVELMIKNASNIRDKAIISLLWETGCRIGELGNLRIKHVSFDDYGGVLRVNGKTGTRRVRFISSVPYVSTYLNFHSFKNEPESALWLNNKGKPMIYKLFVKQLKQSAKNCGIKKRVNPHSFRHARATHLSQHLTEAQMKEYFGWTQSSNMASVYIHLSGRDVDNALLEYYGLKKKSNKLRNEIEKPLTCSCGVNNPKENKFCFECGKRLIKKEEILGIEQLAKLLQDKDLQKLLKQKLKEAKK